MLSEFEAYDAVQGRLNDDDIMPWGKHRDERLGDVPEDYWLWFLRQPWCDKHPRLVDYANVCVADDDD